MAGVSSILRNLSNLFGIAFVFRVGGANAILRVLFIVLVLPDGS
jgi:hypothetical protein